MFLFPFVHQSIRNEWGHHIEYNISIWWSKTFHPILFSRSSLHISFSLVKLAYRPQIISFTGSPAEKADLEVADEILEVNGESLENSNHTDVIAHIHNVRSRIYSIYASNINVSNISCLQCIKSRTICLRVKRRTSNKLGIVFQFLFVVYLYLR